MFATKLSICILLIAAGVYGQEFGAPAVTPPPPATPILPQRPTPPQPSIIARCEAEDLERISFCYTHENSGSLPFLTDLVQPIFTSNVSAEYWDPICEGKSRLNECIGKETIDKCFNIQSIIQLPFSPLESGAKIVIASFLELDHICDKLFKLSPKDHACLEDLVQTVPQLCKSGSFECAHISAAMNCTVEAAYEKCGKAVGCYEAKSATLQMCYVNIICQNCNSISVINSPIIGLCSDDEPETIPAPAPSVPVEPEVITSPFPILTAPEAPQPVAPNA